MFNFFPTQLFGFLALRLGEYNYIWICVAERLTARRQSNNLPVSTKLNRNLFTSLSPIIAIYFIINQNLLEFKNFVCCLKKISNVIIVVVNEPQTYS